MDDVATKIIDILKKHMKEPRDDIGLNTALTDLKIESLDLAMIVFDIEDSFGSDFPDNYVPRADLTSHNNNSVLVQICQILLTYIRNIPGCFFGSQFCFNYCCFVFFDVDR